MRPYGPHRKPRVGRDGSKGVHMNDTLGIGALAGGAAVLAGGAYLLDQQYRLSVDFKFLYRMVCIICILEHIAWLTRAACAVWAPL